MIENKDKFATKLYEILDDLMLSDEKSVNVSIDKLLTPQQKYSLIMSIISELPMNNIEMVNSFHNKFKTPRENTHIVTDFKSSILRFNLILEEVLELGQALGFTDNELYTQFVLVYRKVITKTQTSNIINVLDALTDILFVTYGAIDIFNLTTIQHEAMEEVYTSNMSKLIPITGNELEVIKDSRKRLKEQGIDTVTNDLKNNYLSITNIETGKIQKPVTYSKPNLKTIINKHLKNK